MKMCLIGAAATAALAATAGAPAHADPAAALISTVTQD